MFSPNREPIVIELLFNDFGNQLDCVTEFGSDVIRSTNDSNETL